MEGGDKEKEKDSDGRRGDPRSRQAWICETKVLQFPVDEWRFVSGDIQFVRRDLEAERCGSLRS